MQHLANPQIKKFKQLENIIWGENEEVAEALTYAHDYQNGWNFAVKTDVLQMWLHPPKISQKQQPQTAGPSSILQRADATESRFSILSLEPDGDNTQQDDDWVDVAPPEPLEATEVEEQGKTSSVPGSQISALQLRRE